MEQISSFHVSFWLSHILVYLFYLCSSLGISRDISKINKQRNGLARKGRGNGVKDNKTCPIARELITAESFKEKKQASSLPLHYPHAQS